MSKQKLPYLCDAFLYSEGKGIQKIIAREYILEKLRYPDKNSEFDKKSKILKYFFRGSKVNKIVQNFSLWYLKEKGYNALMLNLIEDSNNSLAKGIIGYAAFQIHSNKSLHIFSVEVLKKYRKNGLSRYMVEKVLEEARKKKIKKIRIGGGTNKSANHVHKNFAKRAKELRILPHKGNWLEIVY